MIAFTDLNGGYYQIDAPDGFIPEWAKGMTPCAVLPAASPDPKDAIRADIKRLEQEQLMPRATREFMLLFLESQFPSEVLTKSIGYRNVKAFDNQIKELRSGL